MFIGRTQACVQSFQAGFTVDDGVMALRVDREHAARYPVDHPGAKQRAVAIEHRLMQIGHQPQQVVIGSSGRERQMLDVVLRIPVRRLPEMGHAAAQEFRDIVERRRRPVRPVGLHDLAHDRRAARRLFEQQHRSDVRRADR
jgi:hypothetical protein